MSEFIKVNGISAGEPILIRKRDVISVEAVVGVDRRYTSISTDYDTIWNVTNTVDEVFEMLEGE